MKPPLSQLAAIFITCYMLAGCQRSAFQISCYPPNGSPGDLVLITLSRPASTTNARVTVGEEAAMIMSANDTSINIMVPPIKAQTTRILVAVGKARASTAFTVSQPSTVRLWFTMKDGEVKFVKTQPSNERFVQNNSYSDNKLLYEIVDRGEKIIARGYINNPVEWEVPSADKKGLSHIERKGPVQFSINVPALSSMDRVRFSIVNASSEYRPKIIGEAKLSALDK